MWSCCARCPPLQCVAQLEVVRSAYRELQTDPRVLYPLPSLLCLRPSLIPLQCVAQLEVVRSACRELQGCSSFSKLLQAVLELGNHLNHVSGR